MEPNENPFAVIASTLNSLSERIVAVNVRFDALNVEQAAHSRLITALYGGLAELSNALRDGREPPAPPKPEQARSEAAEIERLDRMMDQEPPEEEKTT